MRALAMLLPCLVASVAAAQSNVVTGLDGALVNLREMSALGRVGAYPDGVNGVAPETLVCNVGAVPLGWNAAMATDHPFFATLVAAERDGRMIQISGHSYVKHGSQAENGNLCGPCSQAFPALGVGCSDIYSANINGNNYWLGPPEEIDPWLGTWTASCSLFDRGVPPAAPPADCDGVRSFNIAQANSLGPVGNRIAVADADLIAGGRKFVQVFFLASGEDEALRADNLGYRRILANWNTNTQNWTMFFVNAFKQGSVLGAWTGANLASAADGNSDGRVFVASRAVPQGCGYHYEYAIHNRDNAGGVDGLRIPLAAGTAVSAVGFRDLDGAGANDWTWSVVGNELVFDAGGHPATWGTIFNVWFDADAAPGTGAVGVPLVSGSPDLSLTGLDAPLGATPTFACDAYCTAGTSATGCRATISAYGTPSASAPSGFFLGATQVEGNQAGVFFFGTGPRIASPWGASSGLRCVAGPVSRGSLMAGSGGNGTCNGQPVEDLNARWTSVPTQNPGAGATVRAQFWYRDPGATNPRRTNLSDAVEFAVGP